MSPENMTVTEVASYLLISRQTVYMMVREGKIPHFKVGNKIRFRRKDIEAIATPQTKPVTTGANDE